MRFKRLNKFSKFDISSEDFRNRLCGLQEGSEYMGFFRGDIYSYALDKMTPINLYLPYDDNRRFQVKKTQKTLILLHGLEGNCSYWNRYTSVERYAQERNIALIMPDGDMSLYADMRCGQRYATYIGEELPKILRNMFCLNLDRESFYIAGLSMGGYGALRMALTHPETFGRCASYSGALMLGSREYLQTLSEYREPERGSTYIEREEIDRSMYYGALGAYGETMKYCPENDILALAENNIRLGKKLPEILLTCGTEDFLFDVNCMYSDKLNDMGVKNEFRTWPGIHNWLFWEESIRDTIDFFVD